MAIGEKDIRAPPVIRWRKIFEQSPTESSVLPSGEMDACATSDLQYGRWKNLQWLTGTLNRIVPISSSRCEGRFVRTGTLKNLTVWSLLLTAMRGSALLSGERLRLSEVRRTELLIEAFRRSSYCHRRFLSPERRERCISASWPPAASNTLSLSESLREASVFGEKLSSASGQGRYRYCIRFIKEMKSE